jgi:hypothetical protein
MALLNDVRTVLLTFSAQANLTWKTVSSAVLASLAAGAAFNYLKHIPFSWLGLIPLWLLVMNHYYTPVHELPMNHHLDGTYQCLRASGLSRAGYLLASGLLFALTLTVLVVPFFMAFAGLSAGRIGIGHVLVATLLLFPWIVRGFYVMTARIVETPDALHIAGYARFGLGVPLAIFLMPASFITSVVLALVACIYYFAPGLLPGLLPTVTAAAALWPLWVLLSWGLLAVWIVWLGRERHA